MTRREWPAELRYRVLNVERLLWCLGMPGRVAEFRAWYQATLEELVRSGYRTREPMWSEAAVVGSRDWVEGVASTSQARGQAHCD